MSNLENQTPVIVLGGENGTVHVGTPMDFEQELINKQFSEITAGLGHVAVDRHDLRDELRASTVYSSTQDFDEVEYGRMGRTRITDRTGGKPKSKK